jgi:hypothetical protein
MILKNHTRHRQQTHQGTSDQERSSGMHAIGE